MTATHLIFLWFFFIVGSVTYWIKRAYYLVTGPNPVANDYAQFIKRCWAPLLVRFVVDAGIYWATFTPSVLQAMLTWMGWNSFAGSIAIASHSGFFALFFGLGVDSIVDVAVSKIAWLKGWLPQMPGPLLPVVDQNPKHQEGDS